MSDMKSDATNAAATATASTARGVVGKAKKAFGFVRETIQVWSEGDVPSLGASIAFYTVFSLGPLLLIVISIAGFFFGEEAAQGRVFAELRNIVGPSGAHAIEEIIQNADRPELGALASIAGVVAFAFAATGAFAELRRALNTVWRSKDKAPAGIKGFLKDRLLSFAMVLVIGFLMMVSLIGSAAITVLSDRLSGANGLAIVAEILNIGLSLVIFTVLIAAIFKWLPVTHIPWADVWVGAATTTVLFIVGRTALAAYLGRSSALDAYGAASSLVLILLWTYYCAQIFLLGAAVTYVYSRRYGSRAFGDRVIVNDGGAVSAPVSRDAPIKPRLRSLQLLRRRPRGAE